MTDKVIKNIETVEADIKMMQSIFDGIAECTESEFKAYFLPILQKKDNVSYINDWIKIAGNRFLRVKVVDDNDKKKELFRTPPLFPRPKIDTKGYNLMDEIGRINLLLENNHLKGNIAAKRFFSSKFFSGSVDEQLDFDTMRMIYVKYLGGKLDEEVTPEGTMKPVEDDDFELGDDWS